jgi:acetyl-CoA C-acetyltransferase
VTVAGVGSATDIPTIADRPYFHSFPATVRAAAEAYAMAGIKDITDFAGSIHVNMHDPFNGFGPINMVDLGFVPRRRIVESLLSDELTGEKGSFPTNITGGLKGRGHPLGATGMIQIVENHRLITEGRFRMGLAHSIGGPINNNVVTLLENTSHYLARPRPAAKPWGLPPLGRMKPKNLNVGELLSGNGEVEGRFLAATTRFDYKEGAAEEIVIIVSCLAAAGRYSFLFGIGGEHYAEMTRLKSGDPVRLERAGAEILVNRIPVRKFYRRTVDGVLELAGSGWKKLTGS